MNKQEELKEIEETLADLETRMVCLRRDIEEEESKPKYKVGDVLLATGLNRNWIIKVTKLEDEEVWGYYRMVRENGLVGEVNNIGLFFEGEYEFVKLFND